jgi:hypothetical protein
MRLALAGVVATLLFVSCRPVRAEEDWFLTLYGGQYAGGRIRHIAELTYRDTYLAGFGLDKEFAETFDVMRWEVEGQALQHAGTEDHVELAATIIARWVKFPWSHWLATSAAFGSGLSYASEVPAQEDRDNPNGSTRLLHYLLMEATVAVPGAPHWSVVVRVHHRSGVWGLFEGVGRGSNTLVGGVRYRF